MEMGADPLVFLASVSNKDTSYPRGSLLRPIPGWVHGREGRKTSLDKLHGETLKAGTLYFLPKLH